MSSREHFNSFIPAAFSSAPGYDMVLAPCLGVECPVEDAATLTKTDQATAEVVQVTTATTEALLEM